jgi:hypothetical protein
MTFDKLALSLSELLPIEVLPYIAPPAEAYPSCSIYHCCSEDPEFFSLVIGFKGFRD